MNFEQEENSEVVENSIESAETLHPLAQAEVGMFSEVVQEKIEDISEETEKEGGGFAALWNRLPDGVQRLGKVMAFSTILAGASACGPSIMQQRYARMVSDPEMAEIAREAYEQEIKNDERREESAVRRMARESGRRAGRLDVLQKHDPWGVVGPIRALNQTVHGFFDQVDKVTGAGPYQGPRE